MLKKSYIAFSVHCGTFTQPNAQLFYHVRMFYLSFLQGQQQRCRAAPADRAELSHRRHRRRARRRPASSRPASAHVPVLILVLEQEEGHHRRRQEHGKLRLKGREGMRIPLPNRGVTNSNSY